MAYKIFGGEAVPKIFQTFNSLLGGIVRKTNATIVGPSKQLVGEFPEVDFERLYQYYHHWDQVKTAVDVMHQKFRGSGIKIKSNNEYFNTFIEKWWDVTNSEKKWSQFIFSLLITGSAIMELQYTPDQRMGNTEQIPMQTIYRVFRDQFGNELKIVQIVDGVFKELDPQFFIHQTINNPDRQAFGKSMYHTLASPRPITGTVDPFTGEPINASRNSIPLLDAQAKVQNAQIEIIDKMAKPRLVVSAPGMPKPQLEQLQAEMADPNTDQYIWIFDKPIDSAELQVQAQGKFEDYTSGIDQHIDVGTIFASNVIKNPQGFSYSGGQTPLDVLDQRMIDLQSELAETIKDRLLKPLAESWNFVDFEAMEVEVTFTPIVKRLTMEDISGLNPEAVSKKEIREMYKALNIPLDDKLYEEEQDELKKDKQDEKNIQMQSAMMGLPPPNEGGDGEEPFSPNTGNNDNGDDKDSSPSTAGVPKAPKVEQPQVNLDRPKPTSLKTPQPIKKPKGESLHSRLIKEIASENMSIKDTINAIKALERIPLPPKAGDNSNSSSDLYVSQGIDDEAGTPEITDPDIREEFGLDKDESELPPTAPVKMARAGDTPMLDPANNEDSRFTNEDNQGIPQVPEVSLDEYNKHLDNGNAYQGGTGNDGINQDSDGSFKDPTDANNDMERTPESGNTDNPMPHAGPNQEPLVNDPDDLTMNVVGGSDAHPDNTNDQVLGSPDGDENPIIPSEGFEPDYDEEELKKKEDGQNLGEAAIPTMMEKPNTMNIPKPEDLDRDIIEGEDPFTSGTGDDQTPELNQPQKQQVRLDDSPLQDPSANKGNIDGINPSRDYDNTNEEGTEPLSNNGDDSPTKLVPPFEGAGDSDLGDSGQVRLQEEEQNGETSELPLENNSDNALDNTGLNMKPEENYKQVTEDDYMKKVQDGSNPLEQKGDPFEDGMIIKPEDVQQHGGIIDPSLGDTPITPEGTTAHDQDPNTINDPTDSGIDEEQVDPNVLHVDPKTGRNMTDLTDEQGNEVPDLRFDQTPTSEEEQPEVELEYEIVTKEEYDQHLDASKNKLNPQMSEDQFNQELDAQSTDPEAPNPFAPSEEIPQGVTSDPAIAKKESPMVEPKKNDNGSQKQDMVEPKEKESSVDGKPKIGKSKDDDGKEPMVEPKKEKSSVDGKPKKGGKKESPVDINDDNSSGDGKSSSPEPNNDKKSTPAEKPTGSDEDDEKEIQDDGEKPKRKGTVKDIIKREHELLDSGVPEEEVHGLLEDEFGKERIEKAVETKTWNNRK